jgi:hypothetical protein
VLGAAWATPAPNAPPATAAVATQVAEARSWRLFIELDIDTSLRRKGAGGMKGHA